MRRCWVNMGLSEDAHWLWQTEASNHNLEAASGDGGIDVKYEAGDKFGCIRSLFHRDMHRAFVRERMEATSQVQRG